MVKHRSVVMTLALLSCQVHGKTKVIVFFSYKGVVHH
jgi:hypothetical protein